MNPFVPASLNFTLRMKFVYCRSVRKNSLRGTVLVNDPPTNAPSSTRQVLLVSPVHPWNVFPSESRVMAAMDEMSDAAKTKATADFMHNHYSADGKTSTGNFRSS